MLSSNAVDVEMWDANVDALWEETEEEKDRKYREWLR